MDISFGELLRKKRKDQGLTQKDLALAVGKTTMAISLFESGENLPPSGLLLESIISALKCSVEDALSLRFLAAKARNMIPNDINSFFFENEVIYKAISLAKTNHLSSTDLMYLVVSYLNDKQIERISDNVQDN